MKVVKFTEHAPPYFGGDVAGFPDDQAADLIARGIAYEHNVDKESEPAPEAQGELLELPAEPGDKPKFATLEQLEEEVKAAGYKGRAIKAIAKARFEGKHGEEGRYLAADAKALDLAEPADLNVDDAADEMAEGETVESGEQN